MIRCLKFRPHAKNTLKGFADLELTEAGLVIRDCTWHEKEGREWVGLPARPFEKEGKTKWQPLVELTEDADRDAFQNAALGAIRAAAGEQAASPSAGGNGPPFDDDIPF